jgi:4a-hydroxytetrahydrobiopterin dehydratase
LAEFVAADGVDDWVVFHGGAVAVFTVGSLLAAAQLAGDVASITGVEPEGSGRLADDHICEPPVLEQSRRRVPAIAGPAP